MIFLSDFFDGNWSLPIWIVNVTSQTEFYIRTATRVVVAMWTIPRLVSCHPHVELISFDFADILPVDQIEETRNLATKKFVVKWILLAKYEDSIQIFYFSGWWGVEWHIYQKSHSSIVASDCSKYDSVSSTIKMWKSNREVHFFVFNRRKKRSPFTAKLLQSKRKCVWSISFLYFSIAKMCVSDAAMNFGSILNHIHWSGHFNSR